MKKRTIKKIASFVLDAASLATSYLSWKLAHIGIRVAKIALENLL